MRDDGYTVFDMLVELARHAVLLPPGLVLDRGWFWARGTSEQEHVLRTPHIPGTWIGDGHGFSECPVCRALAPRGVVALCLMLGCSQVWFEW